MCFCACAYSGANGITCLPRFVAVLRNQHITPSDTIASDPTCLLRSSRIYGDRKRAYVHPFHALGRLARHRFIAFAPNLRKFICNVEVHLRRRTRKTTNHEASTSASSSPIDASSISGALTCVVVTVVIPTARFPPRLKA